MLCPPGQFPIMVHHSSKDKREWGTLRKSEAPSIASHCMNSLKGSGWDGGTCIPLFGESETGHVRCRVGSMLGRGIPRHGQGTLCGCLHRRAGHRSLCFEVCPPDDCSVDPLDGRPRLPQHDHWESLKSSLGDCGLWKGFFSRVGPCCYCVSIQKKS